MSSSLKDGLERAMLVFARWFRRRQKRSYLPRIVNSRDFFFHCVETGVKTFVPSGQIPACIFLRQTVTFAMRALHLKYFVALNARSLHGDSHAVVQFAERPQQPMQRRGKINSHAAARLVPGKLISRRNISSVANFFSQSGEYFHRRWSPGQLPTASSRRTSSSRSAR